MVEHQLFRCPNLMTARDFTTTTYNCALYCAQFTLHSSPYVHIVVDTGEYKLYNRRLGATQDSGYAYRRIGLLPSILPVSNMILKSESGYLKTFL